MLSTLIATLFMGVQPFERPPAWWLGTMRIRGRVNAFRVGNQSIHSRVSHGPHPTLAPTRSEVKSQKTIEANLARGFGTTTVKQSQISSGSHKEAQVQVVQQWLCQPDACSEGARRPVQEPAADQPRSSQSMHERLISQALLSDRGACAHASSYVSSHDTGSVAAGMSCGTHSS